MAKSFFESQVDFVKSVKLQNLKQGQRIGIIGALVLLIGTFIPVLKLPYVGDVSLYNVNNFMALVIAVSAIVSGYLFLYPKIRYIIISNIVASVAFLYSLLSIWGQVAKFQSDLQAQLKGSPFGAYLSSALGTMEIGWFGWLVMVLGIAGIFYAVKSDLKSFYSEMKDKAQKMAKENAKTTDVEVEPKKKEIPAEEVKPEVKE